MSHSLADFRTYAESNMMELEAILSEVYIALAQGKAGFSLFDGGAHKGYHTMRMADLPGVDRVYAVEADPFMAETLKANLGDRLNLDRPKIHVIEAALQNNPIVTSIPWKSSPSHVGRSSIVSANPERNTIWGDNPDMEYREDMSVAATTIDSILAQEAGPVPFLKLDLEGADLLALQGAASTLQSKRPIVAFENSFHAPKVHGFTLEDMSAYFQRLGYQPLSFIGEDLVPENWFGFFEAWTVPTESVEWLRKTVGEAVAKRIAVS